jgi:RNA polymerase sigma-70 factor (ECF subfamily)
MLVRRHEARVFNFVLRLVGDRTLAEDLTQEVFLRVFQRLPTYSFRCKFTTWLFQVTKNRVLDELRDRERRPCQVTLDRLPPLEAMHEPLEQRELAAALWRAIEGLPSDLKMALVLRDVVGLSYSEIAEALEIRLSTVKWRIFAAREEVVLVLSRAETLSVSAGFLGPALPRP